MGRVRGLAWLAGVALAVSGCADSYVDPPGNEPDAPEGTTPVADADPGAADAPETPPPDGEVVGHPPDAATPTADARCGFVYADEELLTNETIRSCNGIYTLRMQGDGNLVLYDLSEHPVFASDTDGSGAVRAIMQNDGNLVLYRACSPCSAGYAVWASHTEDNPGAYLVVSDAGRLVILSGGGVQIWRSN